MFSKNDKVSIRQVEILLVLDLLSSAVLILPRNVAEFANQDGWIVIIGATLLALLYGYIITKIAKKFPKDTFVEFSSKILTKPVGIFLSILLLIKICISTSLELRAFGELIKQILLPRTPIEIIIASMLLIASYLVRKGYECRARLGEILIFVVLIPLIAILIFVLPDTDLKNLKPIFTTPITQLFKGAYFISFTYVSVEFLLMVGPLINKPKKLGRISFSAIGIVGVINTILVIITLGVFGAMGTKKQIWPVMVLMQVVEIPGAFIERQEALMMTFWILTVFSLISAGLYFISFIITRILKSEEQRFLVLPLVPILYLLSLFPDNIVETLDWIVIIRNYFSIFFLLPIPLTLLLVARLRKLGESIEDK